MTTSLLTNDAISTDATFTGATNTAVPSQLAVKTYIRHEETREPTGFKDPELVVVTYDSTARTITLTGTVEAYWRGVLIPALVTGWVSAAHAATNGPWYLLYDGTNFVWQNTEWTFDQVMIAYVHYDATHKYAIRECHGLMQWQAHRECHETIGTYRVSGGDLSAYTVGSTTAANRRPAVAACVVKDEDLITTNPLLAAGGPYTQLALTSTGTTTFTTGAADIVSVTGAQPNWNQFSTPNWVQTPMSNNSYMSIWLVAVPATASAGSQAYRYLWVQGQTNGSLAGEQGLSFGSLNPGQLTGLFTEFVPIARVIIQYTAGNWTITQVDTLAGSRISSISTPSGTFLSSVAVTAPITGSGTGASPLAMAAATASVNGYMTSTYAAKLDGITAGAQVNILEGVTGTAPIVASAVTAKSQAISINPATTLLPGSMSAADKAKLDGVAAGATANLGTVTSVAALTLGTAGTDLSSTVATGTTTPVITLQVPTASASNRGALSAADWSTFNGKQAALSGTGFVKSTAGTISYDTNTYALASAAVWGGITGSSAQAAPAGGWTGNHGAMAMGALTATTGLFSDNVMVTRPSGDAFLRMTSGASSNAYLGLYPAGVPRNFFTSLSSGSFVINSFDSSGTYIDDAFSISNTTGGLITISRPVSMGALTANSVLLSTSTGSPGQGGVFYNAGGGLTIHAKTGATYDYQIANPAFTVAIMWVPAGTNNVGFAASVSMGALTATTMQSTVYTVAGLPAGVAGMRAFVSDALGPTFGAAVVGGGAVVVPVFHDGVSWKVG